jgi:hypothetical protein
MIAMAFLLCGMPSFLCSMDTFYSAGEAGSDREVTITMPKKLDDNGKPDAMKRFWSLRSCLRNNKTIVCSFVGLVIVAFWCWMPEW